MWLQPGWLDISRLWGTSDQYRLNMPQLLECNKTMSIIGNPFYFIIAFCINNNSMILLFTK